MSREDAIRLVRRARSVLEAYHVRSVFLFGSFARDEGTDASDIDLLVEFDDAPSLFEFVRLRRALTSVLGRRVDLVTREALAPRLSRQVLAEAVRAI